MFNLPDDPISFISPAIYDRRYDQAFRNITLGLLFNENPLQLRSPTRCGAGQTGFIHSDYDTNPNRHSGADSLKTIVLNWEARRLVLRYTNSYS